MKDIINKVATGGYDALSDSEYAELKKLPDQVRKIVNKAATGGYDALSDSEYTALGSVVASPTVAPAAADITRAPVHQLHKRQQNLDVLGNIRAAAPDYTPSTWDMLLPRVTAAADVDTTQYDRPGPAQLGWAGLKDVLSLPGRTAAGALGGVASGIPELLVAGDESRLDRASKTAALEGAKTMAAPTDLGNQGGASGFLEATLKDPTNVLFAGGPAIVKQVAQRVPQLKALKPLLTGAAGREDAAKALGKMTEDQAADLLARRAAAGAEHAKREQALQEIPLPEEGPGFFGLEEGTEGANAAMRGYLSAAERGAAAELDPRAKKILDAAYTPQTFAKLSPNWIAQKLGNISNVARANAALPDASFVRRAAGKAVDVVVPTAEQAVKAGVPLATYSSLDAALSGDDRVASPGWDLVAGTALGTLGQGLKYWGAKSFPGASPAVSTARGPGRSVRQTVQQNLDELIGQDLIPTLTGTGYKERTERQLKDALGKQYSKLRESVLPSEVISPDEIIEATKANLDMLAQQGADIYRGPMRIKEPELFEGPSDAVQLQRELRPEIQSILEDARLAMLGKQHVFATPTNLPPMPPVMTKAELSALTPAQRAQRKIDTRAAKEARANYEASVQEQVDNPVLAAEGLFDLRTAWNDPVLYRDAQGAASQAKKHVYEALHQAANKRLEQLKTLGPKTYGEMLADADLGRQYSLWSSFRDVLHSPRTGLQSRLSTAMPLVGSYLGNAALDSYLMPTLKYTAGRYLQQTPGLASQGARILTATPDTAGVR